MGGDDVDYSMSFQLYLQTKMQNPYYPPEISAQCTIVNFIVTEQGLEEQLLADVVNKEKAELEQERQQLVKSQNDYKVQINRLEEELLSTLEEAVAETILENTALIEKLDETKTTSNVIEIKQEEAKKTQAIIAVEREVYRPVAAEGSMLYFLCCSLRPVPYVPVLTGVLQELLLQGHGRDSCTR